MRSYAALQGLAQAGDEVEARLAHGRGQIQKAM